MKIAIASDKKQIRSSISPQFGRCEYFFVLDTETGVSDFIENPVRLVQEKAGSEAVNFLKQEGVCLVIAGRFGSKAIEAFRTNNIQMIVPEGRQTINEIINKIK